MNLVFIGKQGVGKGTYAQRASEKYCIPQLSTGDLLRAEKESGSELGKKFAEIMKTGALVPDNDVALLLEKRMLQTDAQNGFILDGFPRTENQAKILDELLKKLGKQIDLVLNFVAPEAVLLQRLTGRRQCSKCGKIYHLVNIPPKQEGICDIDGAQLFQRDDDKEEAIRKRWEIFEQQTKPVLDYYSKAGKLVEVDASKEVVYIMPKVEKILDNLSKPKLLATVAEKALPAPKKSLPEQKKTKKIVSMKKKPAKAKPKAKPKPKAKVKPKSKTKKLSKQKNKR